MTRHLVAALLASAAVFGGQPAIAEEVLAFGTSNSEQHPLVTRILTPWVDRINAEAEGLFRIELRNGPMIVSHNNYFDRVQDDVVQIVWGMAPFDPGRFPRALVAGLPFLVESSEQGGVAACLMHERGHFGPDMADIVPLAFVQFPQSKLHFNGLPATGMEDIAGRKVMVASPTVAGVIEAYGGAPLSINVAEMYQALQRGTAEGAVMNWTAFPGFRLHEVTTDHLDAPLGGALGMVFMMRDRYEALPEAAREVLARNSGCEVTRELGAEVDRWEADATTFVRSQGERRFHALSEAQLDEMVARVGEPIVASFVARTPDGEAVLSAYREALQDAMP